MTTHAQDTTSLDKVQRVLLKRECELSEHEDLLKTCPDAYETTVKAFIATQPAWTTSTKVRAAALLWRVGRKETAKELLAKFKVNEVLSMVKLLDSNRQIEALAKKLSKVKKQSKASSIRTAKKRLENEAIKIEGATASGALMRHVKKWASEIPAEKLEFFLLNFPKEPWQELANLVHFSPKDFKLDYFLPVVFGAEPPAGTLLHTMKEASTPEKLVDLIKTTNLATCYSFLRANLKPELMTPHVKLALAKHAPLSDVIWWYEELDSKGVEKVVQKRLKNGESIEDDTGKDRDSFGKLMERLLLFRKRNCSFLPLLKPRAQKMLDDIKIPTTKTVAVLGDASSSMQVAVNSATIIGSVVCSCLEGSLRFFHSADFLPSVQPRTVDEILKVTEQVQARGSTAPVASLMPYYLNKKPVDLFIVVTDEEENTLMDGAFCNFRGRQVSPEDLPPPHQCRFSQLFLRYVQEVYAPAQVFFVSFLRSTTDEGQMMKEMRVLGLEERCSQFRFDPTRPDLTKLNALLNMISVQVMPVYSSSAISEDDLGDVPIFCMDGTLTVSKSQAAAIKNAFVSLDRVSKDALLKALPNLRLPDNQGDQEDMRDSATVASSVSGWSFVQ